VHITELEPMRLLDLNFPESPPMLDGLVTEPQHHLNDPALEKLTDISN
jgi:hypothetical protein